jgi:RNA polymerase sigma-70 factor (ECF subfamily)
MRRVKLPELENCSDEEIMTAVREGSGDAFAVVFDRYHRLVLVTALKIVRDVAEAEEVTQNVFFEIYRSADKFDAAKGSLKVWLLQYAYHRSINRRNYLLLRQFYNRPELDDVIFERAVHLSPHLSTQEIARAVKQALETLSDAQRHTIDLVFFQGLTLRDVADKRKETLSNVRNHYYRGLERLRGCLTETADKRKHEVTDVWRGESCQSMSILRNCAQLPVLAKPRVQN